ncbi:hypothetical protein ACIQRJ_08055 [Streptomyces niveus]
MSDDFPGHHPLHGDTVEFPGALAMISNPGFQDPRQRQAKAESRTPPHYP